MGSKTINRGALVRALQAAIRSHMHDAEHDASNLAVLRVLRAAGATWSDVLGPATRADPYAVSVMQFGNASKAGLSPADCGRGVLHLTAWTPPGMMASAAVLAALPEPQHAFAVQELQAIVQAIVGQTPDDNRG